MGARSTYPILHFNRLVRRVEQDTGLADLSPHARDVLRFVGEYEMDGEAPKVCDVIIGVSAMATAPTIYARLNELSSSGWIEFEPDAKDGRAKRIRISGKARKAFASLSKELMRMAKEAA